MSWPSTISFDCTYYPQPFLEPRLVMVTCGVLLAVFSIIFNFLLVGLFASCPCLRNQYHCHSVIAVIDIVFATFFFMNSAIIFAEYFEVLSIFELWHKYARLCIAGSQISFTSSTYVIFAMAIEHALSVSNRCKALGQSMRQHRRLGILLAIGFSVLFKGTIFWEIVSVSVPGCERFARNYLTNSELAYHPVYNAVWRLWTRNFATVIGPFVVLLCCVFSTISCDQSLSHIDAIELTMTQKIRTKATARVLLLIASYLLANILNVAIAVFELASASKPHFRQGLFYILGVDAATVLTIFVDALRLFIYAYHDRRLRQHLYALFRLPGFRQHHNMHNEPLLVWTVRTNFEHNHFVWCSLAPEPPSQVAVCIQNSDGSLSDRANSQVWVKEFEDDQLIKEANADIGGNRSEMRTESAELPHSTANLYSTEIYSCPRVSQASKSSVT